VNRTSRFFWVDVVLAGLSTVLVAVTLVWPDWIELVTGGHGGDGGGGLLEWVVTVGAASVAVTFAVAARGSWRRRAAGSGSDAVS
jgi:hypothetical protein